MEEKQCKTCVYAVLYKNKVKACSFVGDTHCIGFNKWESNSQNVNSEEEIGTQEKIELLFTNFKYFLKEKNRRYGDSAMSPMQVFSKESADNQICNRLDDKLGRIKNSNILKKNDVSDLFGYIALLMIRNDWLTFDDLLD